MAMTSLQIEVQQAIKALEKGDTILYPTDTVWGLGCDATSDEAIEKIIRIKRKTHTGGFIILLKDISMMHAYGIPVSPKAKQCLLYSKQPTTVILPSAKLLPGKIYASDGSVAVRIPKNTFCLRLLDAFQKPIVSTSANLSGKPTPPHFSHIHSDVLEAVDHVVNLRFKAKTAQASAIVRIDGEQITYIRK